MTALSSRAGSVAPQTPGELCGSSRSAPGHPRRYQGIVTAALTRWQASLLMSRQNLGRVSSSICCRYAFVNFKCHLYRHVAKFGYFFYPVFHFSTCYHPPTKLRHQKLINLIGDPIMGTLGFCWNLITFLEHDFNFISIFILMQQEPVSQTEYSCPF